MKEIELEEAKGLIAASIYKRAYLPSSIISSVGRTSIKTKPEKKRLKKIIKIEDKKDLLQRRTAQHNTLHHDTPF